MNFRQQQTHIVVVEVEEDNVDVVFEKDVVVLLETIFASF
jgi:hypothetical protein